MPNNFEDTILCPVCGGTGVNPEDTAQDCVACFGHGNELPSEILCILPEGAYNVHVYNHVHEEWFFHSRTTDKTNAVETATALYNQGDHAKISVIRT